MNNSVEPEPMFDYTLNVAPNVTTGVYSPIM